MAADVRVSPKMCQAAKERMSNRAGSFKGQESVRKPQRRSQDGLGMRVML
jgi:hypothetical protein